MEDARRDEVDDEPGDAGGEHPAARHAGRVRKPADPRPDDPDPERDEHERVDKGGQHLSAPPAEAPLGRRRAVREPGGEERQPEGERVREHVRGVGEERQGAGGDADERLDAGEAEHEREDERERPALTVLVPVGGRSHRRDRSEGSASRGCALT